MDFLTGSSSACELLCFFFFTPEVWSLIVS